MADEACQSCQKRHQDWVHRTRHHVHGTLVDNFYTAVSTRRDLPSKIENTTTPRHRETSQAGVVLRAAGRPLHTLAGEHRFVFRGLSLSPSPTPLNVALRRDFTVVVPFTTHGHSFRLPYLLHPQHVWSPFAFVSQVLLSKDLVFPGGCPLWADLTFAFTSFSPLVSFIKSNSWSVNLIVYVFWDPGHRCQVLCPTFHDLYLSFPSRIL